MMLFKFFLGQQALAWSDGLKGGLPPNDCVAMFKIFTLRHRTIWPMPVWPRTASRKSALRSQALAARTMKLLASGLALFERLRSPIVRATMDHSCAKRSYQKHCVRCLGLDCLSVKDQRSWAPPKTSRI
jgi:hypothetical protein